MDLIWIQRFLVLLSCLLKCTLARVTAEEARRLVKIHSAKMKCQDHPKMCNYYFSRGFYNDCAVGGIKWYFCPRSCGYCALLDAGSPIPTPTTECQDFEGWCQRMAKYGECESQEDLSKMFCRKSCKFCLEAPPCYDKDELCPEFARDGMCMFEPEYMRQFCEKSCNMCFKPTFPPKNICADKLPEQCATLFAESTYDPCIYNRKKRKWLSLNCRKSCKMCERTGDCFDEDSLCPWYKRTTDYCTNTQSQYHTFMLKKCKYSCGVCKDE